MNEHKKSGKLLKRLLVVCLCLVMALGSAVTIIAASFDGDLNGDGKVTALDAQMLAEYEAGLRDLDLSDKIGLTVKSIIDWILGRTASEPNLDEGIEAVVEVKTENGEVTKEVSFTDGILSVTVREGTKVTGETLTVSVKKLTSSESDVALEEGQELLPLDIHVEGVAADNTTPIIIGVAGALDAAMNEGNLELYHVENGVAQPMNQVESAEALSAHNDFYYDPANGDITVSMATFSEVAMVSDTDKEWEGNYDYSWYTADDKSLTIANADQLAAFGAIVGGMATHTTNDGETVTIAQDTFNGKTVELLADINLGDAEDQNKPNVIFYPIGYYYVADQNGDGDTSDPYSTVYSFEGTFNGKGHTISNFYQNTWEMKGDDSYYDLSQNHYYNDAMGLFGYVVDGVVQNLTVDNFSSDGEFTPTGVIAAYAVNSTFKNIAITNCNPRVYNTGNGGIIGIAGSTSDVNAKITLENITVDNTNKISALWGSWDVACGGLVGMFRGNADSNGDATGNAIHFENCHVSAQIDVYNDVCANYQYYAYRYAGMIIGSVRHNTTNTAGQSIPNMAGITAKDCTVNYGTWNDYYYCELVANSIASYTHDYQFSRLVQIASLDEIKSGETWLKTGNFLLIDGNDKTCYHIVKDEEGNLKQHLHTDAGYEKTDINGDGNVDSDVLLENNQIIYLPFDQMFTGYGWGVNSQSIDELDGIMDITMGTQEASVVKFESIAASSYNTGNTVTIGELFKEKEDNTVDIDADNVQVFVSPKEEGIEVGGTYVADTADWTKGTLTFTGDGEATITITDYNFCTPTTINVTITERANEQKFELVFPNTDSYLYRVGNQNTVTLSSLFKAKDGAEIGTVSVTVEPVDTNVAVSGTYKAGTTTWDAGTIQFSGTGVVKVTITDNDYCTPTTLTLEVVDAKNATSATSATANNVVLLKNTSGTFTVSNGYTFYGNGFKVTCSGNGSYGSKALSYGFVTVSEGGVLDNVQIICDIFPASYLYTGEMTADSSGRYPYAYSAIAVTGNSTISNCYIYGARNNIFVGSGNVTIENTVTECGSLSNIQIKSSDAYTVTLDNVTTIQYQTSSSYDTSKKVLGFGVVVGDNESTTNAAIKLTGDLKQYNWVTSSDTSVSNTYAKTAITEALKVTDYQHTINNTTTVNMGIAYLNSKNATIYDERDNKTEIPYKLNTITMSGQTGQVYSISGSSITADSRYNATTDKVVAPNVGCDTLPTVAFSGTTDAVTFTYGYDSGEERMVSKLVVDLDSVDGGTYTFNVSDLKVQKHGADLTFVAKDASGNMVTSVILSELFTGEYTLEITDDQLFGVDGSNTGEMVMRKYPFVINATKTSIDPPKFTNAGTATAIRLVSSAGGDWRPAYTALTGVSVTYWSASEKTVKTVDLSSLYDSGAISSNVWTYTCDDYTLTITGGAVHSDGSVITPVIANNTLYFASTNKAFGTGTTSRSIILTYNFTDKNASTPWNRTETVTYSELSEYDYNSFKNDGKLEAPSSGGCLMPDTLVTLADGSQMRVDALTGNEEMLVWNLETGSYDTAPIVFVDSEEEAEYEVVNLHFSDGSKVGVVYEHGFFDLDLGKYVYLDAYNAESYIGHTFVTQGDIKAGTWNTATLTDVVIEKEVTKVYSPVTFSHLCYYTDGVLSMPGGIEGLFNIFDVDTSVMAYDAEKKAADIETYGLFTLEDFGGMITEEAFYAFNGAYLKVAMAKGLLTWEDIAYMAERYIPLM